MGDRAAGLTYYSLLSLFPALLFAVAVLGYFGQQGLITDAANYLRDAGAPSDVVDAVTGALQSAQDKRGTAFGALVLGLATSLWGASGAFGAAGRALNVIWRVEEGRGFVRKKATDLGATLTVLVLLLLTLVLVFLGGSLASDVFGAIGLGDTAGEHLADRPLAGGAVLDDARSTRSLYYAAPNVEVRALPADHARRRVRRGHVDRRLGRLLRLRLELLVLRRHLRRVRRRGDPARLAVADATCVLLLGAELNAVIDLRRTPEFSTAYDGPPLPAKVPADD